MQTDMGKCTSQWTNNSEHCHYVNLVFEGFFAEVLTSFSKGISGVGFELADLAFNYSYVLGIF